MIHRIFRAAMRKMRPLPETQPIPSRGTLAERSSPSRVRFARACGRALDRCGPLCPFFPLGRNGVLRGWHPRRPCAYTPTPAARPDAKHHEGRKTQPVHTRKIDWLQMAPEDETQRRDYLIRLLTLLAHYVSDQELEKCVASALCSRGRGAKDG
jgi:hypothetical protein